MFLYVCGYLDNKVRIFELNRKTNGPVHILNNHNARVTCIKFSKDYKFLFTCDADGVIHHYQRNCHRVDCVDMTEDTNDTQMKIEDDKNKNVPDISAKKAFPFDLLYTVQDQMDEIVDIDTNQTLDMYVTLSRDGTIALRCMRTSHLWQHFMLISKQEKDGQEKVITDYQLIFGQVNALKLSLHGYIIVVGKSPMREVARYLIYSLNGDLLRMVEEFLEIKSVFLNTREDWLIIAMNFTNEK